jgi:hypothetical protein
VTGLRDAFDRIGEAAELHLPRTHAAGLSLAVTDHHDTLGAVVRVRRRGVRPPVRPTPLPDRLHLEVVRGALRPGRRRAPFASKSASSCPAAPPGPFGRVALHHLLTHTSGLAAGVEHGPWGMMTMPRAAADVRSRCCLLVPNLRYKLIDRAGARDRPVQSRLLLERMLGRSDGQSVGASSGGARLLSRL